MNHFIGKVRTVLDPRTNGALLGVAVVVLLAGCGRDATTTTPDGVTDSSSSSPSVDVAAATSPTATSPAPTNPASTTPAATDSGPTEPAATSAAAAPTGGGGSATDPCALLTGSIAAAAIGSPVAEPIRASGEGNASCSYHAADPAVQRFAYLTTYAVTGSPEVLAAAAATFHDAQPVPGLGDAAEVSVESQAIGVLDGTQVFALGVIQQQADGTVLYLTVDQLAAVARAVLDGR